MKIAIRTTLLMTIASGLAFATTELNAQQEDQEKKTVAVLVFDRMEVIDFAAPLEVFGWAGFETYTVSKKGESVKAWPPLNITPDHSFANAPTADIILVPGGFVSEVENDADTLAWIRQMQQKADYTLSVCTGSRILAGAGLLDNKTVTTFFGDLDGLASDYPKSQVVRDQRFVDSDHVVTSAGLVSGMDSALYVVSKILGVKRARTIATQLEYPWHPNQGYVRGLMADRHIPDFDEQFPKSWNLKPLFNYGDKNQWFHEVSISREEIANTIDWLTMKVSELDGWSQLPTSDEHEAVWRKKIGDANWRMTAIANTTTSVLKVRIEKE